MPKLVLDPITQLSQDFHDLAFAFGHFCYDHWDQLTPPQRAQLRSFQQSLLDSSELVDALAIAKILSNLKLTMADLRDATVKANKAVQQIKLVDKIFAIGVSATVFAADIAAGQFQQIPAALQALLDAILPAKSSTAIASKASSN